MIRNATIWLVKRVLGNIVTPTMVREMIDTAFRYGHLAAQATPTSLDDAAIEALERNVDKNALANVFSGWLNDRIKSA